MELMAKPLGADRYSQYSEAGDYFQRYEGAIVELFA
jgi:hypothetical protein